MALYHPPSTRSMRSGASTCAATIQKISCVDFYQHHGYTFKQMMMCEALSGETPAIFVNQNKVCVSGIHLQWSADTLVCVTKFVLSAQAIVESWSRPTPPCKLEQKNDINSKPHVSASKKFSIFIHECVITFNKRGRHFFQLDLPNAQIELESTSISVKLHQCTMADCSNEAKLNGDNVLLFAEHEPLLILVNFTPNDIQHHWATITVKWSNLRLTYAAQMIQEIIDYIIWAILPICCGLNPDVFADDVTLTLKPVDAPYIHLIAHLSNATIAVPTGTTSAHRLCPLLAHSDCINISNRVFVKESSCANNTHKKSWRFAEWIVKISSLSFTCPSSSSSSSSSSSYLYLSPISLTSIIITLARNPAYTLGPYIHTLVHIASACTISSGAQHCTNLLVAAVRDGLGQSWPGGPMLLKNAPQFTWFDFDREPAIPTTIHIDVNIAGPFSMECGELTLQTSSLTSMFAVAADESLRGNLKLCDLKILNAETLLISMSKKCESKFSVEFNGADGCNFMKISVDGLNVNIPPGFKLPVLPTIQAGGNRVADENFVCIAVPRGNTVEPIFTCVAPLLRVYGAMLLDHTRDSQSEQRSISVDDEFLQKFGFVKLYALLERESTESIKKGFTKLVKNAEMQSYEAIYAMRVINSLAKLTSEAENLYERCLTLCLSLCAWPKEICRQAIEQWFAGTFQLGRSQTSCPPIAPHLPLTLTSGVIVNLPPAFTHCAELMASSTTDDVIATTVSTLHTLSEPLVPPNLLWYALRSDLSLLDQLEELPRSILLFIADMIHHQYEHNEASRRVACAKLAAPLSWWNQTDDNDIDWTAILIQLVEDEDRTLYTPVTTANFTAENLPCLQLQCCELNFCVPTKPLEHTQRSLIFVVTLDCEWCETQAETIAYVLVKSASLKLRENNVSHELVRPTSDNSALVKVVLRAPQKSFFFAVSLQIYKAKFQFVLSDIIDIQSAVQQILCMLKFDEISVSNQALDVCVEPATNTALTHHQHSPSFTDNAHHHHHHEQITDLSSSSSSSSSSHFNVSSCTFIVHEFIVTLCDNSPLRLPRLQATLTDSQVVFERVSSNNRFAFNGELILCMRHCHPRFSEWEPVLEETRFEIFSVMSTSEAHSASSPSASRRHSVVDTRSLNFMFASELNFDVGEIDLSGSVDFLENIVSLWHHRNQSSFCPARTQFVLKNRTAGHFAYIIDDGKAVVVEINEDIGFDLGGTASSPRAKLCFQVPHCRLIENVYIGVVGTFVVELHPLKKISAERRALVLECSMSNGQTNITVHSAICITNNCSIPITLRITAKNLYSQAVEEKIELAPQTQSFVPLAVAYQSAKLMIIVSSGCSSELQIDSLRHRSQRLVACGDGVFLSLCIDTVSPSQSQLFLCIRSPLLLNNRLAQPLTFSFGSSKKKRVLMDGQELSLYDVNVFVRPKLHLMTGGGLSTDPKGLDLFSNDHGKFPTFTVKLSCHSFELHVRIEIMCDSDADTKARGFAARGFFEVTIFAELWLLDHTNLGLSFGNAQQNVLPGQRVEVLETAYENQRWFPFGRGWLGRMLPTESRKPWSDYGGTTERSLKNIFLPGSEWKWLDNWCIHISKLTDNEGWQYAVSFDHEFRNLSTKGMIVRRRRYERRRVFNSSVADSSTYSKACMFSTPNDHYRRAIDLESGYIAVSTGDIEWSTPVNLTKGTHPRMITVFSTKRKLRIDLGVNLSDASPPFQRTRVAVFVPRFQLQNEITENDDLSDNVLFVQEYALPSNQVQIPSCSNKAFYFSLQSNVDQPFICVGVTQSQTMLWSLPFRFDETGLHVINLRGPNMMLPISLHISLDKAVIIILASSVDQSRPRFMLYNELNKSVKIWQQRSPCRVPVILSPHSMYKHFAWEILAPPHLLSLQLNSSLQDQEDISDIALDVIGFTKMCDKEQACAHVFALGATNVLILSETKYGARSFAHRMQQRKKAMDTGNEVLHAEPTPNTQPTIQISLRVKHISLSVIDERRDELLYLTMDELEGTVRVSDTLSSGNIRLRDIQIDNQTMGRSHGDESPCTFAVIVQSCSKNISSNTMQVSNNSSKNVKENLSAKDTDDVIHLQWSRSWHTNTVKYFKLLSLELGEIDFHIEEVLLFRLMELAFAVVNVMGALDTNIAYGDKRALDVIEDMDEVGTDRSTLLYFEMLRTPALQISLSFKKAKEALLPAFVARHSRRLTINKKFHTYINNVWQLVGAVFSNIERKPIRRDGRMYVHLCERTRTLQQQWLDDYRGSLWVELLSSLGYNSAVLGVIPTLNTVGGGVRDFIQHTGAGRFGKGTFSLIDGSIRGASIPITGLASGVGDAISALTFSDDFAKRRAANTSNKPKHVMDGLVQGSKTLLGGVVNGVTGLVREPLAERKKRGGKVSGLAIGFGKGVVQALAAPAVGIADAMGHVVSGVSSTPQFLTSSLESSTCGRKRLPRAMYRAEKAIKIYSKQDALIWQSLLDAGQNYPLIETFVNASRSSTRCFFALQLSGVSAIQLRDEKKPKLLWYFTWQNILRIKLTATGVIMLTSDDLDEWKSLCVLHPQQILSKMRYFWRRALNIKRLNLVAQPP